MTTERITVTVSCGTHAAEIYFEPGEVEGDPLVWSERIGAAVHHLHRAAFPEYHERMMAWARKELGNGRAS